jgi:hypothetical protein
MDFGDICQVKVFCGFQVLLSGLENFIVLFRAKLWRASPAGRNRQRQIQGSFPFGLAQGQDDELGSGFGHYALAEEGDEKV